MYVLNACMYVCKHLTYESLTQVTAYIYICMYVIYIYKYIYMYVCMQTLDLRKPNAHARG